MINRFMMFEMLENYSRIMSMLKEKTQKLKIIRKFIFDSAITAALEEEIKDIVMIRQLRSFFSKKFQKL